MPKPGPTGRFPHGKLGPHDEGELAFAVVKDAQGNVHIDFGKPVAWFAMPPETAIQFAKLLLKHAGVTKIELIIGGPDAS